MGASKGTYDKVLELLGEVKGKKILDCGAGKGSFTQRLIMVRGKVYACDLDISRFDLKIPFKQSDFNKKIPFDDSFFDGVVSIEVIEHLENPFKFIQELNRILKKGGELILTTPNIQNIKSKIQFLFRSEFHWFQGKEFGDKGSKHIHPLYWLELIFMLEKCGFRIDKTDSNRTSGYTFYYSNSDYFVKKAVYFLFNFIADAFYHLFSIFLFPKSRALLLGDILIIKATKN